MAKQQIKTSKWQRMFNSVLLMSTYLLSTSTVEGNNCCGNHCCQDGYGWWRSNGGDGVCCKIGTYYTGGSCCSYGYTGVNGICCSAKCAYGGGMLCGSMSISCTDVNCGNPDGGSGGSREGAGGGGSCPSGYVSTQISSACCPSSAPYLMVDCNGKQFISQDGHGKCCRTQGYNIAEYNMETCSNGCGCPIPPNSGACNSNPGGSENSGGGVPVGIIIAPIAGVVGIVGVFCLSYCYFRHIKSRKAATQTAQVTTIPESLRQQTQIELLYPLQSNFRFGFSISLIA